MKYPLILPVVAGLLTACGNGNGGAAGTDASLSSATLPPNAVQVAALGDASAAGFTKEGPPGLASTYPRAELQGARGDGDLYWLRNYQVTYSNRVIWFDAVVKTPGENLSENILPSEVLVWKDWNVEVFPHQDATTFSGPTLDNRQAWITVHHNGTIIGAGYHDAVRSPASFLRLGNPEQDGHFGAPEVKTLTCGDYSVRGAPVDVTPYQIQVRYDRKAFPWSSIDAVRVPDGGSPGMNLDPGGQFFQPPYERALSLSNTGREATVTIGGAALTHGRTEYHFKDGNLVSIRQGWRHSDTYCQ